MKGVFQKRRVKDHCSEKNFQMFTKHNNQMDEIQKKIEEYLDEKRTEFPRLYFMSNDELLQLLSKSNIEGVEPQLNKLFDQLYRFQKSKEAGISDLFGMISADGEQVEFSKVLKVNV